MAEEKISMSRRPVQQPSRTPRIVTRVSTAGTQESMADFGNAAMMPRRAPRQWLRWGIMIVVLMIVAGFAGYAYSNPVILNSLSKPQKFHAVFLTNGQAYFGTIRNEDSSNIVLDHVFYMQLVDTQVPGDKPEDPPKTVQQPQLIKKGDEFYGPTNSIRINRAQVTVIEELTDASQVLKQIRARL